MFKIEVRIPKGADTKGAIGLIERLCAEDGLERKVKRGLRSHPGGMHWHYRREHSPGTLKVNFWPDKARIWFSVHRNRTRGCGREEAPGDLVEP